MGSGVKPRAGDHPARESCRPDDQATRALPPHLLAPSPQARPAVAGAELVAAIPIAVRQTVPPRIGPRNDRDGTFGRSLAVRHRTGHLSRAPRGSVQGRLVARTVQYRETDIER